MGFGIHYKLDGNLFNLRRLRTSKSLRDIIRDLLYIDDAAFACIKVEELQKIIDNLYDTCTRWGLATSKEKTDTTPTITIGWINTHYSWRYPIKNNRQVCVLGKHDHQWWKPGWWNPEEISQCNIHVLFIPNRVWHRSGLSLNTKLIVYHRVILAILLYGSETWATLNKHLHQLEMFHQRCLCHIMDIRWW